MHVHQELDQLFACVLLRAIRQMVKLRDHFAELPYVFLKSLPFPTRLLFSRIEV